MRVSRRDNKSLFSRNSGQVTLALVDGQKFVTERKRRTTLYLDRLASSMTEECKHLGAKIVQYTPGMSDNPAWGATDDEARFEEFLVRCR